jgi:hypothetical protein
MMDYFAVTETGTFSCLWLGWLALFIVVELVALKRGKGKLDGNNGGTFSELIWRLKANKFFMVFLVLFWVVLGYHFFIDNGV